MEITPQEQKAILQLVEQGVEPSTAKLGKMSRTAWEIRTTSLKAYAKPEDYLELAQPSQYFFGAYCQAPGKMFLSYLTSRSAAVLTQALLAGSRRGLQADPRMQEVTVVEVSNILMNAVAATIADRCGMAFILTSPKPVRGARSDIIKAAFGEFPAIGKIFSAQIHLASKQLAADCTLMVMLDDLIINFILNALDL